MREPLINYEEPLGGRSHSERAPLRATEEPRGGERSHSERAPLRATEEPLGALS